MEINVGLEFIGKHFSGKAVVLEIDEQQNELKVKLSAQRRPIVNHFTWVEVWNLEHTLWGFDRGDYFLINDSLHEIGIKHECDKADKQHSHAAESYFHTYERYFDPLRFSKINLLEIGVRDGKSLRVWREYFMFANICGIDINPASAHQDTKGCKVEICSQDDAEKLNEISLKAKGWDIVIDDASHLNELTIKSFLSLWPHVRSKGLYIIEDLNVSYTDLSNLPAHWNFVNMHPESPNRKNDRQILNDLFFNLIADLDTPKGDVRAIHFYHQIVIIEKI